MNQKGCDDVIVFISISVHINPTTPHRDPMKNDQVKGVNMLFLSKKSVDRKGRDDVIMTARVQLYQCMMNLIKSHQDWLRNDQVISVNMLFLSEISEAESP